LSFAKFGSGALSEFICLLGGPAYSEFQRQKLMDGLGRRTGQDVSFSEQFIYFVEVPDPLSQDQLARLEALLQAGLSSLGELQSASGTLLVVPRLGTQSPWSSKATDIAHRCGLNSISRIERGTLFHLPSGISEPQTLKTIRPLIH